MSYYGTSIADLLKRLDTETGAKKADTLLYLAVEHKPTDRAAALEYANQALEICRKGSYKEAEIDYWTVRAILEEGVSASEKAIEHLEKAVALAQEIGDEQGRLTALQKIGMHKLRQHKADEAGDIFLQCIEDYKTLPNTLMKAECYHQAATYLLNTDLKRATEISLAGIEIAKQLNKLREVVPHLKTLQNIALKSGDDAKAIEYGLEILRIKDELNDSTAILGVAKRIAQLYQKQEKENLAKQFFQREIDLHHHEINKHRLEILQNEDAETYFHAGKSEEAILFSERALTTASNNRQLGNAEFQYGQILFLTKLHDKAAQFLEKSIHTKGNEIPATDLIKTLDLLYQCYENLKRFEEAFCVLKKKVQAEAALINAERVKEVAALNKRYETDKREAELREIKLQQAQSELKAIKAQMNPHFIFNALNSIQEMFFIGDKRLANEHLGKFSQLTREILKASGKQFITLTEEIEMLKKYLDLEGLRFETDFSFTISVNDENAADDIFLPPMLVQPYIENSVRHGLLHKKGEKKINVNFNFNEEKKLLTCMVADNGIGRHASTEINKNRTQLHESFSTSANAKRLELLNQNRDEKIGVTYEDLHEGTKVTILIPINYD